jgi:hypothetical protein
MLLDVRITDMDWKIHSFIHSFIVATSSSSTKKDGNISALCGTREREREHILSIEG